MSGGAVAWKRSMPSLFDCALRAALSMSAHARQCLSAGWRGNQRRDQVQTDQAVVMVQRQAGRDARDHSLPKAMNREYPSRAISSAHATAIR